MPRVFLLCALLLAVVIGGGGCATPAPPAPAVVYVVRHAERLDASEDPPLSAAGRVRAAALADSLARRGLAQVFATRFIRAQQTAAPAAARTGRAVETYGGTPDAAADARALVARLRAAAAPGRAVLVVGHSNTVPTLLNAFDGGQRPDLHHADYDGLYRVVLRPGRPATVERLRVGADDGTPDPS